MRSRHVIQTALPPGPRATSRHMTRTLARITTRETISSTKGFIDHRPRSENKNIYKHRRFIQWELRARLSVCKDEGNRLAPGYGRVRSFPPCRLHTMMPQATEPNTVNNTNTATIPASSGNETSPPIGRGP